MKLHLNWLFCLLFVNHVVFAQQSVARQWNEAILQSIREDYARPPVAARTLYYTSMAMYEAWAAFDTTGQAKPYLLNNAINGQFFYYEGMNMSPVDIEAARQEAISFAVYRVVRQKFFNSLSGFGATLRFNALMASLGYDINNESIDYSTGSPAALGNQIGQYVILLSLNDGANELGNYAIQNYTPVNPPLNTSVPGNPDIVDPNSWQPLNVMGALDQNGNPISSLQVFQSPEWGKVYPFAMNENDRVVYTRNGWDYPVYHDPGPPPQLNLSDTSDVISNEFKWNHSLVSAWASHHDQTDGVMWDISPGAIGNVASYPQSVQEYHSFYDFENGGDHSTGHSVNPFTGQPYVPQIVPRGDYTRVLSQYWADGPMSETPPGHWYVVLNKLVNDHPAHIRKFGGKSIEMDPLEWDVKAYFTLGGAVHDAAISAWGIKGWYNTVRPISALRYMAGKGQSSDPALPSYDPAGIELIPGFIELVYAGDSLAGDSSQNVGKIKLYTWKGHRPDTLPTGTGWILAENWTTYQKSTFVTPPFAGYISGHSTYSRAAAEALTQITGNEFFPGGMAEVFFPANSNYLVFEQGPSVDLTLQWARFKDASDQCSLSRIWGGIHPPMDDIPGRIIGSQCGYDAFTTARSYFYEDKDFDGFYSYEDCNDLYPLAYPGAPELCDGLDNDCNGLVDEGLIFQFYVDNDGDGYGNSMESISLCDSIPPIGYSTSEGDCDDSNNSIYLTAEETCDGIDNNCNGVVDENLPVYQLFVDSDGDGFGNSLMLSDTCINVLPFGFSFVGGDCNDSDTAIYPGAWEAPGDSIDNNCDGLIDNVSGILALSEDYFELYPNPVTSELFIVLAKGIKKVNTRLFTAQGVEIINTVQYPVFGQIVIDCTTLPKGVYYIHITDGNGGSTTRKVIRI